MTSLHLLGIFGPHRTRSPRRSTPAPEAVAAALLVIATIVALLWANMDDSTYQSVWHTWLGVEIGDLQWGMDLRHLINDGLMTFFFALITLEVRRELEFGELHDWRKAAVPVAAAAAGILVPAAIYLTVTAGTPEASGWGTVVSTDTAFVLGLLALLGRGLPPAVRVFLVTLAVADDIGALAVIAVAYTDELSISALVIAMLGLGAIAACRWWGVWRGAPYLVLSVVVWLATLASGVHATLAGVAIALLLPVFEARDDRVGEARRLMTAFAQSPSAAYARDAEEGLQRAISVNDRAHRLLSPYVNLAVLPLFALANAGVRVDATTIAEAARSPLTWGIVAALVLGKPIAVIGTVFAISRIRPGLLPAGVAMRHVVAVGLLSGVGFTLSLFIAELAFADADTLQLAHLAILVASLVAVIAGGTTLVVLERMQRRGPSSETVLPRAVDADREHTIGPDDAPLSLVEYGDLSADFDIARTGVLAELRARFGEELQYTFRHASSVVDGTIGYDAALASEAAARQGRFGPFREALSAASTPVTAQDIRNAASHAGVNIRLFDQERVQTPARERVRRDVDEARRADLRRVPTLFIGGRLYQGSTDARSLIDALERSEPNRRTADGRMTWSSASLEWIRVEETQ
ncbi:Na+/H+ antiporter NhaA [Microbacterium sp. 1.5R]|uniref:Na+/H+ antiporter NhaA n=1 Tax=Microbacterium sp. 1.5R TaxID=1916917 RepID=UPI00090B5132|nr:Na+/H+ antiporter NhaA [Microbacterium sp. 1.5R]APH43757.1 Na+/H+ antiporter NhaA [Microbacterium sp. 1.5R]